MSSTLVQHEDNAITNTSSPKQHSPYNGIAKDSTPAFESRCARNVDEDEDDLELGDEEQLDDVKEYDPQIRQHLEELNRFATKINQLEKCVEEENSKFQKVLNESSIQLNKFAKKIGEKYVTDARPYYDAIHKLKSLQIKCQIAAIKFEKYNELHTEAKQAIADTELMFHKEMRDEDERDGNFDHIWQEKLNQANMKFIEARTKRKQFEDEHMTVMMEFRLLESKVATLLKKHKNSIKKSKIYFDEAAVYDSKRKAIKENIEKLGEELVESKRQYSKALKDLENISEEIHEKRSQILAKSLIREPGVGAELAVTYVEVDGSAKQQNLADQAADSSAIIISDLEEKLKQL